MAKSIRKNYFYNLLYQLLTIIIPIVTAPYLARVLGVSGTGISSYTLSLVSYFIVFGSMGVSSYGQREIAMHRHDKEKYSHIFWELFLLKGITSIISILGYFFMIYSMNQYVIILFILTFNILASILDISWFFQGLEEYKFLSLRNIIIKLTFTIAIFLFIKDSNDLTLYILLNSLSLLFSSLSLWIKAFKLVDKIPFKDLKILSHLKSTIIYFLPQIATQIYTMLDKTMLGVMTGTEIENGYYEQAYKIITMSLTLITSLNTVMSPRMSYLYKEEKIDEIKLRLSRSLKFIWLLSFPMVTGLILVSHHFVPWFFGSGYEKVQILLPLFAPIILFISISNCLGSQCLTPCGKRLKSAGALWCGAIVNCIFNFLLIPKYTSVGAIISSLLAECTIAVLYFYLAREYLDFKAIFKSSFKYLGISLFMGCVLLGLNFIMKPTMISTVIEISVGVLAYGGVLFLCHDEFIKEISDMLLKLIRRRKQA